MGAIPVHPNCRCTVLAVWESKNKAPENGSEIIMDLVSNSSNNINNQNISISAIEEFNKLRNNKNIECSIYKEIEFKRDKLNDNELSFKYYFKDTGVTIYKSVYREGTSVTELHNYYKSLPKKLRESCNEIVISSQTFKQNGKNVGGYVTEELPNRIYILNSQDTQERVHYVFTHELAHCLDGNYYIYSNSPKYLIAFLKDLKMLRKFNMFDVKDRYITKYSYEFTRSAINGDENKNRPFIEDFAECIAYYFTNRHILHMKFPEKEKYITDILYN